MKIGFEGAYASSGRVIRIQPIAELTGPDEISQTVARWRSTQGVDPVPPVDERSARILAGTVRHNRGAEMPYECRGDDFVQICTIAPKARPKVELRWWRSIAESRLERLRHHALRRCYDSTSLPNAHCTPAEGSNEPRYELKPNGSDQE